jgi:hypothetical protein
MFLASVLDTNSSTSVSYGFFLYLGFSHTSAAAPVWGFLPAGYFFAYGLIVRVANVGFWPGFGGRGIFTVRSPVQTKEDIEHTHKVNRAAVNIMHERTSTR